MKKFFVFFLSIGFAFLLSSCSKTSSNNKSSTTLKGLTSPTTVITDKITSTSLSPTSITTKDLSDYIVVDVSTLEVGSTYTISESGNYALTGTNSNLVILVDAKIDLKLALNGVDITSLTDTSPIYVKQASSFTLELVDGTTNNLSDSENNELDAVLEVKKTDLIISGNGLLNIYSNGLANKSMESGCGIYNSKTLIMKSGMINIKTSADHAISAKTGMLISGGFITIENSLGDGLHSKEGDISISNLNLTSTTYGDAIQASSDDDGNFGNITIDSGTFNIKTNGVFLLYVASEDADGSLYEDSKYVKSGTSYKRIANDSMNMYSTRYYLTQSSKGLKADNNITINNGTFNIDSTDDAIKTDKNIYIFNGDITINTYDDAISSEVFLQIGGSDTTLRNNNFKINIETSYEGLESSSIEIYDALIIINSIDDGINASTDDKSLTKNDLYIHFGGDTFLVINNEGDGIDSNGNISMAGGTVYIFASNSNGNAALDYDNNFFITAGTLIAVGASGMAQVPDNPEIYTLAYNVNSSTLVKDSYIQVASSNTSYIIKLRTSYTQGFSCIISSSDIKANETYTLKSGGTTSSILTNNVALSGDYSNGSTIASIKVNNLISTYGSIRMGGSKGGGFIGGGGMGGSDGEGGGFNGRPGGR